MAPINSLASFVLLAAISTCMALATAESRKLAEGDTQFTVEASGESFSFDFKDNGDNVIAVGEITIAIDVEGSVTTEVGSETYYVDDVSEGASRRTQEVGLTGRRLQSITEECENECALDAGQTCGILIAMCAFDLFPPIVESTVCPALDSLCDQGGILASCEATCVVTPAPTTGPTPAPSVPPTAQPIALPETTVARRRVRCGFNGGDPHIVTLDGLLYDCHGRGEFFLTKVDSTQGEVQVRFEPWSTDPSGPFTVTTAMAASEEGSSVVQVSLAASGSALEILVDGATYGNTNTGTGVTLRETSSGVDIEFPSGMEVKVTFNNAMLTVDVDLPPDVESTGLLGNNNDDAEDDWMTQGGGSIEVPGNPTEAEGTSYCTTNWCTTESTSIFTYVAGENHGTYDFCDEAYVEPVWPDTVPENIIQVCDGSDQCVFDFVFAGEEVGRQTLQGLQFCICPNQDVECDDPHMQGLRGQRIDWSGVDGGWYSLIKDEKADLDVNVRVTAPLPDEFPDRQLMTSLAVLSQGHSVVVEVENPYTIDTDGCPEGVSPCLANGGLRIHVDGQEENELLRFSRQVPVAGDAISVSASNLPVECRQFGGDRIWARQYEEMLQAMPKRRLRSDDESLEDWILRFGDGMAAPDWCAKYIAENDLADLQANHAIFKIETSTVTIRLNAGINYQGDGELNWDGRVLPNLEFWQMDIGMQGLDVENPALSGLLGETAHPVYDENGKAVMEGLGALRGTVEDYRVSGALGVHFPLLDK